MSILVKKETININVLTHLAKGRIEKLVATGTSFSDANAQAKAELLHFLGISEPFNKDFDAYDISYNQERDGALLAFSIILQRYTPVVNQQAAITAELSQLLTNLSSDFADNGQINNTTLINALLHNISQTNLIDIRNNITSYYNSLGIQASIPNFEKYIAKFQAKNNPIIYTSFTYPATATPEPIMSPNYFITNILIPTDTVYPKYTSYSLAACTPLNQNLTVKFRGNNSQNNYTLAARHGWIYESSYPNGFTLIGQRQNVLITTQISLGNSGTAIIEYYENGALTPSFTKKIRWY